MPNFKGSFLKALKLYVLDRFDEESWQKLVETLPPDDRERVDKPLTISWYDERIRKHLLDTMCNIFASKKPDLMEDFSRFEAERDLNTTQRLFLRLANPGYAIQKAGQYWRRFMDWGELVIVRHDDKCSATATIKDNENAYDLFCNHMLVYMTRVLELVGAKNVKLVHTHCRNRGDAECVYSLKWD